MLLKRKPALCQCRRHIKKKDRFQPVEAEAFPHFGEEQGGESARMTKESTIDWRRLQTCSGGVNWCAHVVSLFRCCQVGPIDDDWPAANTLSGRALRSRITRRKRNWKNASIQPKYGWPVKTNPQPDGPF